MTDKASRNRRLLWHTIAIVFIIAVAFLLFLKNFFSRGILMHVDMTFPMSIGRNFDLYAHTWWPYGSVQNIWNTQRVIWAYPLLVVVRALGLSTSQYLLVLFISTFALAGVSMYALAYFVINRYEFGRAHFYAALLGATLAGLIYMYNPFSVSHLWPYFGYPGFAVLPLVFLLLYKAVETSRLRYVVALAVLISAAGTGPINVAWFWLLILAYVLYNLVANKFDRRSLLVLPRVALPLGVLYALLNAMWLLPISGAQVANRPFIPVFSNQLTQQGLDNLSAPNAILNNLRFASGWGLPVSPQVSGTIWVLLSFALPVFAIAGMLVLRKKIARDRVIIFWSLMFVFSVLLATGSLFILRGFYSYFTLNAPGARQLWWVLRAADRWLCYAAIFYALVLGLLATWLLAARNRLKKALAVALAAVVLLSFGPIAYSYAVNIYDPTHVPSDYEAVSSYIQKTSAGARPMRVPFSKDGFYYYWAPQKRIGAFDVYSTNTNLNNLQDLFARESYYYWLESLFWQIPPSPMQPLNRDFMLQKDLCSRLFIPFSARYMVNDTSVPGYNFGQTFDGDASMRQVKETENLKVYELKDITEFFRPAGGTVKIDSYYDGLALTQKLSAGELQRISFTRDRPPADNSYKALSMKDYLDYYEFNGGFEQAAEGGKPAGWTPLKPSVRVSYSVSDRTRRGGKQSVLVENTANEDLALGWINGPELQVEGGQIYTVESNIRYKNSKWTHVAVEGYDQETGAWVRLVRCPTVLVGDSGWRKSTQTFYLPEKFTRIRASLAAGWKYETNKGPAYSWFDDVKIARVDNRFYEDLLGSDHSPAVTYQRVSQEEFKVKVRNASGPFMLVFGEAYDALWVAKTPDGEVVDPVRLYATITGFPIDRQGDFDLTIEYLPQRWFTAGLVVSLVAYAVCLVFLAGAFLGRRRDTS